MLAKLAEICQEWEESQDQLSIDYPVSLTMSERLDLKSAGFTAVSQLFLTDELRSFEKTVRVNIPNQNIQMKISNIIKNIKRIQKCPTYQEPYGICSH